MSKDPRKQYQGAVNKAQGQHFETLLESALADYANRGIAFIEKTPEPMRPTKRVGNGKFVAHFEKQAQPDYKGVLMGGRAIVFEAKHTMSDRIEQSRITPEQWENLCKYYDMGAVCFVLVGFSMQQFFRIPWMLFQTMKEKWGRKYVKPEDLQEWTVKTGRFGQPLILGDVISKEPPHHTTSNIGMYSAPITDNKL